MSSGTAIALALRPRALLPPATRRKKITVLILGQSTEQGPVLLPDKVAYPGAFASLRNPGMTVPRGPMPVANRGGWHPALYDALWDWGYDADILNGAIGGVSLLTHICGYLQVRQNSVPYYQKRTGTNAPDLGDFGDVLQVGARVGVVTGGRKRQAYNGGPHPGVVGTSNYQDFVAFSQTSEASGASAPDLSTISIGQTIADGTLTLTRLDDALYPSEGTFFPGIDPAVNNGLPNRCFGGVFGEQSVGAGFDPLGIIHTAWQLLAQAPQTEDKIVWFSQGQSDLGGGVTTYQRAVQILANFFLRRGCKVVLGNTIYSPASANSTATFYGNQVASVDNAVAALAAIYPGKVYRGTNLYGALGSTGAMGGQACTGGTGGVASATLTISAVQANSGTGIAVGQNVWNGKTLVGVISAPGTGTGGTGTYTLDRTVTLAAGTALICAGSGLQFDGVHFNGSMAAAAGSAVADSFKAFLPQLAVL